MSLKIDATTASVGYQIPLENSSHPVQKTLKLLRPIGNKEPRWQDQVGEGRSISTGLTDKPSRDTPLHVTILKSVELSPRGLANFAPVPSTSIVNAPTTQCGLRLRKDSIHKVYKTRRAFV
ncbi:hypothetical protein PLEOSDRAFT_1071834, partial [Pleurotus ostreatus PC15]